MSQVLEIIYKLRQHLKLSQPCQHTTAVTTSVELRPAVSSPATKNPPHLQIDVKTWDPNTDEAKISTSTSTSSPQPKELTPNRIYPPQVLDTIANLAGSRFIFLFSLILLLVWTIAGIAIGPSQVWQIVIQNASSIQCYVSDTLLMRQQQINCHDLLGAIAEFQSKNLSCARMLKHLTPSQRQALRNSRKARLLAIQEINHNEKENFFDRACNYVAIAIGSLYALLLYCAGICTWLAFGPSLGWGSLWQLDINTAVAVELTFTSIFLQNIRRRHGLRLSQSLHAALGAATEIESRLRKITGDVEPDPELRLEQSKTGRIDHGIDFYAHFIGSGVGVTISAVIVVAWIAVGHRMGWDSNWWLIIGTYTGLVGFVDGFGLRNVYFPKSEILDTNFQALFDADMDLYTLINSPTSSSPSRIKNSISYRISYAIGFICSLPHAVVGSVVIVVALLCIASGMRWSETAQLICNTPTMIVEGFFLLVLFQAHNMSKVKRREQVYDILVRRRLLNEWVICLELEKDRGCE
jgi:low-affinity ferrous iron transport protein